MKSLTLPVINKFFSERLGKTAIECRYNQSTVTVWANGDKSLDTSLLANVVINEVGDKFTATNDSKTLIPAPTATNKDATKPAFLKGEVVTRQKESIEFKSLAGNNSATQFAQAANAFGLQLVVQMA